MTLLHQAAQKAVEARQGFESWMRRAHPQHSLERTNYPGDHGEGDYVEGRTHDKWQTWQSALQQQPEPVAWRPIESAPKDGTHILAWTGASVAECRWYGRSSWGVATFNGQVWVGRSLTHWQPMPAAPSTPAREEAGLPAVDSQTNPPADGGKPE